jgi:hypothetical protein
LITAITRCDVEWLERFLSRKEGLQGLPNKQLRRMAQSRKIKDYQYLCKDELIKRINEYDSRPPQDASGMPCDAGEEQGSRHSDDSRSVLPFDEKYGRIESIKRSVVFG